MSAHASIKVHWWYVTHATRSLVYRTIKITRKQQSLASPARTSLNIQSAPTAELTSTKEAPIKAITTLVRTQTAQESNPTWLTPMNKLTKLTNASIAMSVTPCQNFTTTRKIRLNCAKSAWTKKLT